MVDLAIEPFVVNPAQFILDYPLAFACLGLAGFFRKLTVVGPVVGVVVGGTGRFLISFRFRCNLLSPVMLQQV